MSALFSLLGIFLIFAISAKSSHGEGTFDLLEKAILELEKEIHLEELSDKRHQDEGIVDSSYFEDSWDSLYLEDSTVYKRSGGSHSRGSRDSSHSGDSSVYKRSESSHPEGSRDSSHSGGSRDSSHSGDSSVYKRSESSHPEDSWDSSWESSWDSLYLEDSSVYKRSGGSHSRDSSVHKRSGGSHSGGRSMKKRYESSYEGYYTSYESTEWSSEWSSFSDWYSSSYGYEETNCPLYKCMDSAFGTEAEGKRHIAKKANKAGQIVMKKNTLKKRINTLSRRNFAKKEDLECAGHVEQISTCVNLMIDSGEACNCSAMEVGEAMMGAEYMCADYGLSCDGNVTDCLDMLYEIPHQEEWLHMPIDEAIRHEKEIKTCLRKITGDKDLTCTYFGVVKGNPLLEVFRKIMNLEQAGCPITSILHSCELNVYISPYDFYDYPAMLYYADLSNDVKCVKEKMEALSDVCENADKFTEKAGSFVKSFLTKYLKEEAKVHGVYEKCRKNFQLKELVNELTARIFN